VTMIARSGTWFDSADLRMRSRLERGGGVPSDTSDTSGTDIVLRFFRHAPGCTLHPDDDITRERELA
jgi:hypothetical protein